MKNLEGMLDEYYEALGLERDGIPKRGTVKTLDLEDIADSLWN
jgi:aldehyde:ferredoxin oxidoreductase